MSKTSQNKKVAAAVKGQKAAKVAKAPREKKTKIAYVFKPLAKNFTGIAGKATMAGQLLKHVPFHDVRDGKTACGYDVTVQSKGLTTYELNWQAVTGEKVNCGRCIRFANKVVKEPKAKKEKAAKKPTPISKGKAVKAKKEKAAAAASAE